MIKIEFHDDREPALDETTLNTMQTNIENAINQAVVYSSNETICGSFLGKTLYRRVWKRTGVITSFDTGITNMEDLVTLMVMSRHKDTNDWRPIPWIWASGGTFPNDYAGGVYVTSTGGHIEFQCGGGIGSTDKYIIVMEYTKTS